MITTTCQSQKKDNSEDRLCYVSLPMPKDTIEMQTTDSLTTSFGPALADIPDTKGDSQTMCYTSLLTEDDILIPPEPSCYIPVSPNDTSELLCYMGIDVDEENLMAEDTVVYIVVEEMPEFPGGTDSLMKYIDYNIKYPPVDENVVGRVIVSFIVEKDGSISNVGVIRSIHSLFDKEALRVVRGMPVWRPGKQRGQVVRVKYTLPVRFR